MKSDAGGEGISGKTSNGWGANTEPRGTGVDEGGLRGAGPLGGGGEEGEGEDG